MNRTQARQYILEAIDESGLLPRQKLFVKTVMRVRPFATNAALDLTIKEANLQAARGEDGEVEAAFDWKELFALLLPLFLRWLGL